MTFPFGQAPAGLAALLALALAVPPGIRAQVPGRIVVRVLAEGRDGSPTDQVGTPLVGARVSVESVGLATETGPDGSATLTGLAPGRHRIRVEALGFSQREVEAEVVNGRAGRLTVWLEPEPIALRGLRVSTSAPATPRGAIAIDVGELDPAVSDLAGAIDRVPGATVVRSGGPGAPTTVQLRGSAASQVLVLLDGIPINSPVTGVADLSTVDLASLERVVVLPGSRSSRYGPGALGGVILLETKHPGQATASLSAGVGAWRSRELSGAGARPLGDRWLLVGGARWDRSDGDFLYEVPAFRGGGESRRANAAHERRGGDIRLERSGRVVSALRLHTSRLERGSPGGVVQPSLTGRQRHDRYGGTADFSAGSDHRGASLLLGLQWQQATYADSAPPFGAAYDAATDVREGRVGSEAWTTAGPIRARGGLELTRTDVTSTSITPDELALVAGAGWLRAERALALGASRLDLGAGVRVDRHDLVEGTPVSPSADVVLRLGASALSASWSYGFSPPSLGDLFFQEGVLVEPNPELGPERVRNDVTLSLEHTMRLGAQSAALRVSAYDADIDDMVLWFPDHRYVWSPVNFDVARSGIEVAGRATLRVLDAEHGLTAGASWSRVEYREGTLQGQVAYRPDFTADVSASITLPLGSLNPIWRHVGERRSTPGSDLNKLPPYDLVDVGLAVPFVLGPASVRLDVAATNLFDERAELLVDYPLPGRGWSTRLRLTPDR